MLISVVYSVIVFSMIMLSNAMLNVNMFYVLMPSGPILCRYVRAKTAKSPGARTINNLQL